LDYWIIGLLDYWIHFAIEHFLLNIEYSDISPFLLLQKTTFFTNIIY